MRQEKNSKYKKQSLFAGLFTLMYKTRNKCSKTTEFYQFHFNMLQMGFTDTKYCRLKRLFVVAFCSVSLQIHPKTTITVRHFESVHCSSSGRISGGQKTMLCIPVEWSRMDICSRIPVSRRWTGTKWRRDVLCTRSNNILRNGETLCINICQESPRF